MPVLPILLYFVTALIDVMVMLTSGPWVPLFPDLIVTGYLLLVGSFVVIAFIGLFQVVAFSERRRSVETAWNLLLVLGLLIHLLIIPIPPEANLIFLASYFTLLFLLRITVIRSAVIRCYKAEYSENKAKFQEAVDRASKTLHPEDIARQQGS